MGFGMASFEVKVGLKLMYTAWCCLGRCADQMNAWLKLMIPLLLSLAIPPLSPAPPSPLPLSALCTTSEGSVWRGCLVL